MARIGNRSGSFGRRCRPWWRSTFGCASRAINRGLGFRGGGR